VTPVVVRHEPFYIQPMCGRIIQSGGPELPGLKIHLGTPDDSRVKKPRYNGAPSQDLRVIRRHRETGEDRVDLLRWGLVPFWMKEPNPKTKPINATAERVASAPMFKSAYAKRRCIVPVNGFFEWKAIKGAKAKQPFAIGMGDGRPFGLAGIWENWKHPRPRSGCAPSASSPRRPTNWLARFTTVCR
jgi:putative SOS response-associated peptidase YedK